MNIYQRLRYLAIITFLLSFLIVSFTLLKLIKISFNPIEINGVDFVNEPITGKITLTGEFEYFSFAREVLVKNKNEMAGSDGYYYTFVPSGTDRVVYVKSSTNPVYTVLSKGTEMVSITGIVENISNKDFITISTLAIPKIHLGKDKKPFNKLNKNSTLTRENFLRGYDYLSSMADVPFKTAKPVWGIIINTNYDSNTTIDLIIVVFLGSLIIISGFILIRGYRKRF